jgi:hypothetical protein
VNQNVKLYFLNRNFPTVWILKTIVTGIKILIAAVSSVHMALYFKINSWLYKIEIEEGNRTLIKKIATVDLFC